MKRYIIVLFCIIFFEGYSQQKYTSKQITNVYDSVSFYVVLAKERLITPSKKVKVELHNFMDRNLLNYIMINLQGEKVELRKILLGYYDSSSVFVRVGDFRCYEKAVLLRDKLISDGYTGSYVMGYQCQADATMLEDLRKIAAKRCNDNEFLQTELNYKTKKFEFDSTWFYVRVGNYKDFIPDSVWLYIKNSLYNQKVNITKLKDETYKIDAGGGLNPIKYYKDAIPLLEKIVSDGYKDAHVVAYLCLEEINAEEAKKTKIER